MEQEVCFGLLGEQQTGVVVVSRSVAVDVEILWIPIGMNDFARPQHIARRHRLPTTVDGFGIALIVAGQSALC